MFAKALFFTVFAVHLTDVTPKSKYFLIETQGIGKTEDTEATEDVEGNEDIITNDESEVDEIIPELGTKRPLTHGEKADYAMTQEDALKPMMTKGGKTYNLQNTSVGSIGLVSTLFYIKTHLVEVEIIFLFIS